MITWVFVLIPQALSITHGGSFYQYLNEDAKIQITKLFLELRKRLHSHLHEPSTNYHVVIKMYGNYYQKA